MRIFQATLQGARKGIKLDFKTADVLQQAMETVKDVEELVISKSDCSDLVPLNPIEAIYIRSTFPSGSTPTSCPAPARRRGWSWRSWPGPCCSEKALL